MLSAKPRPSSAASGNGFWRAFLGTCLLLPVLMAEGLLIGLRWTLRQAAILGALLHRFMRSD